MPKKQTNYENRGFARKLSGRIFGSRASGKSQSQWRPRKKKFERLEAGDEFDPEAITNNFSFSVESETGGYKRDLMAKKKNKAIENMKKPDFAGINIQPSARDKRTGSARKKKKQRTDALGFPLSSELSVDYSFDSRQTASTKQTTSHYSVTSDPTNFFSHKPAALTKGNLDKLAFGSAEIAHSLSGDAIENTNPRSMFYQFTIDEDKESTVILPVGYPDEDETFEQRFDDDINSATYTPSKDRNESFQQEIAGANSNNFSSAESIDPFGLPAKSKNFSSSESIDPFGLPKQNGHRSGTGSRHINTELSTRTMSGTSLCYSPSPKFKLAENPERHNTGDDMWQQQTFRTAPTKKREGNSIRAQTQPRPIRDSRLPLSPLNGIRVPMSTGKQSSLRNNDGFSGLGSWSDFVNGATSNNHFKPSDENDDIFQDKSQAHRPRNNGQTQWKTSVHPSTQLYGFSKENKPLNSFDSAESDDSFRPRLEDERPIGIQSFEGASRGSSGLSIGSGAHGKLLYTHGKPAIAASSIADDCSISNSVSKSSSIGSVGKPTGLPSNAIMGSMLFQRHHNVDTRAVEAKLKAKREENSKVEANRGDVPRAIQAQDDMYSCISSFSDDTGIEPWKKPTRDLLQHFANSRSTGFDTGRYRREQRAQATTLFEA